MSTVASLPTEANDLYISPKVISADLARIYKSKTIYDGDIIEWCMQVERDFMPDIETMAQFKAIPLVVVGNATQLPCNVYRILDVYESVSSERRVKYHNNGAYLHDIRRASSGTVYADDTTIYINYVGMMVTIDGDPLICDPHRPACETYCKIKLFEEDVAMGKFNMNLWNQWNVQFSGQIVSGRNHFRRKDRKNVNDLNIVHANMLSRIGDIPLAQNVIEK